MKAWLAISVMWCCLLGGCPGAPSETPPLSVKSTFTTMDAGPVRGKTLRQIISPEDIRLIALIENRGKGSPLTEQFAPDWTSNRLMQTIFSSDERASDLSMSATESLFAKYAIVSKNEDLFILDVVGDRIGHRPVTAVLLASDGFGCRFNVVLEGLPSAKISSDAQGPVDSMHTAPIESQEEASRERQMVRGDLSPVTESDAHWAVVQREIEQIIAGDPMSPVSNRLEAAGRIQGAAIQALFPRWAFYAFQYSNRMREGSRSEAVSLALGLGHTLAVGPDGKTIIRLYHTGNYEDYESLLVATGATIRNPRDAQLIWAAFCDLHRKFSKTQKMERVSDHEWRLGIVQYDQVISEVDGLRTIVGNTHYFRVVTDPVDMHVVTWESALERSPERLEQVS